MPDDADDNPTPTKPKAITPSSETKPAAKKGKKNKPEPTTLGGKLWHNWVRPIGTVLIVVVVLRSMLLDWNDVPSGSMEPEIHVGDRIAVNRLAYALQAPLSGPKLSIPFTGLAWDNPLDGIPQWQWGKPKRGDIVTFWNPVTGIRMVKRIVAEPGDTIAMSGGVMTINGTTATYEQVDLQAEGLPGETKWQVTNRLGKKSYDRADVEYERETLLGETRIVQYIKDRWLDGMQLVELNSGDRATLTNGQLKIIDFSTNRQDDITLDKYLNNNPQPIVFGELRDGTIYIDDKQVSYNELSRKMLAGFAQGEQAELLHNANLSVQGHTFLLDGKPVSMDIFEQTLQLYLNTLNTAEQIPYNPIRQTMNYLGSITMTNFGPVTLGEDEYFMVGDNRNNSHDSRRFGPIDRGEITGEAFAVAFSFKDNKIFTLPPKPAWSRWFKDLD